MRPLILTLILFATATNAATLAWDASAGAVQYRVYWGNASRAYSQSISTTNTSASVPMTAGQYATVTAVNVNGLESDYSAEVEYISDITGAGELAELQFSDDMTHWQWDGALQSPAGGTWTLRIRSEPPFALIDCIWNGQLMGTHHHFTWDQQGFWRVVKRMQAQ
jgi:hypothetical protein